MAPIWAFTGRTEIKGDHSWRKRSLTNADIINDKCKSARVRVDGEINGVPFTLVREVKKASLKQLTFSYGGEDMTCQEARLTQERIDGLVNTRLLSRIMCFDHDHVNALLNANDRQMKDELGHLVDNEFWERAKALSLERLREAQRAHDDTASEVDVRERVLANTEAHFAQCERHHDAWEASHADEVEAVVADLAQVRTSMDAAWDAYGIWYTKGRAAHAAALREASRESVGASLEGDQHAVVQQAEHIKALEEYLTTVVGERIEHEKTQSTTSYALDQSQARYAKYRSIGSNGEMVCDQCFQPIEAAAYASHVESMHADVQKREEAMEGASVRLRGVVAEEKSLRAQIKLDKDQLQRMQGDFAARAAAARDLGMQEQKRRDALRSLGETLDASPEALWKRKGEGEGEGKGEGGGEGGGVSGGGHPDEDADGIHRALQRAAAKYEACKEAHTLAEGKVSFLQRQTNPHQAALVAAKEQLAHEKTELRVYRERLVSCAAEADTMLAVDRSLGSAGIQSFALEGALKQLEELTCGFLDTLTSNKLLLTLNATRKTKSKAAAKAEVESITKTVRALDSYGNLVERNLSQLSGGERRRLGLALAFGFSKLASARGGLFCDLLVLDEVLQHLDDEGCSRVLNVVHGMRDCTVLLVAQPHTAIYSLVDNVDTVVKERDAATIQRSYER